jgi:2-polyprenyl-3-methyl-5-hydroxy-6-metoxy-1,4-benzoquinol methylase
VAYAKQNLNSQIAYAKRLEVIEHLENLRFMVREIDRVLKPGGWLVITTPNNENIRGFVSLFVRGHSLGAATSAITSCST